MYASILTGGIPKSLLVKASHRVQAVGISRGDRAFIETPRDQYSDNVSASLPNKKIWSPDHISICRMTDLHLRLINYILLLRESLLRFANIAVRMKIVTKLIEVALLMSLAELHEELVVGIRLSCLRFPLACR